MPDTSSYFVGAGHPAAACGDCTLTSSSPIGCRSTPSHEQVDPGGSCSYLFIPEMANCSSFIATERGRRKDTRESRPEDETEVLEEAFQGKLVIEQLLLLPTTCYITTTAKRVQPH